MNSKIGFLKEMPIKKSLAIIASCSQSCAVDIFKINSVIEAEKLFGRNSEITTLCKTVDFTAFTVEAVGVYDINSYAQALALPFASEVIAVYDSSHINFCGQKKIYCFNATKSDGSIIENINRQNIALSAPFTYLPFSDVDCSCVLLAQGILSEKMHFYVNGNYFQDGYSKKDGINIITPVGDSFCINGFIGSDNENLAIIRAILTVENELNGLSFSEMVYKLIWLKDSYIIADFKLPKFENGVWKMAIKPIFFVEFITVTFGEVG